MECPLPSPINSHPASSQLELKLWKNSPLWAWPMPLSPQCSCGLAGFLQHQMSLLCNTNLWAILSIITPKIRNYNIRHTTWHPGTRTLRETSFLKFKDVTAQDYSSKSKYVLHITLQPAILIQNISIIKKQWFWPLSNCIVMAKLNFLCLSFSPTK